MTTAVASLGYSKRARSALRDDEVYIGRPSPWGNPFRIGLDGDRAQVIERFREWVIDSNDAQAVWIREHIGELRDKVLVCFCSPKPCHGDVLAEMADGRFDGGG